MIKRLDLILNGKGGVGKCYDCLLYFLNQTLKTAVGRLVLCKPFLATAAVWLDSAARCCGLPLWFCVRKTCPATGTRPPSVKPRQDTVGNKFRIELDKQVLDNRRVAGELLRRPAGSQHQGFANTGNRTGGRGGCPFEKEDQYHHLVACQSEIKEKLGPHEKPGTEPSGRRRHGRLRGQFRETKRNEVNQTEQKDCYSGLSRSLQK